MKKAVLVMSILTISIGQSAEDIKVHHTPHDLNKIEESVKRSVEHFERVQSGDGSYTRPLIGSTISYNALMIAFYEYMGLTEKKSETIKNLFQYINSQRNKDGYYTKFPGGPVDHSLNFMAYVSAKIVGVDENIAWMKNLAKKINDDGGLDTVAYQANVMTLLLGLKKTSKINGLTYRTAMEYKDLFPWFFKVVVPLIYVMADSKQHDLSDDKFPFKIIERRDRSINVLRLTSGQKERFHTWLMGQLDPEGLHFGTLPSTIVALAALKHHKEDKIIAKGIKNLEKYQVEREEGVYQALGTSSTCESAVVLNALLDVGANDQSIDNLAKYLKSSQDPKTGAFSFSKGFNNYPDTDCSAFALQGLKRWRELRNNHSEEDKKLEEKGVEWLLDKQYANGGFSTWGNEEREGIINFIPDFLLGPDMKDIVQFDITEFSARVANHLHEIDPINKDVKKSIADATNFILNNQKDDGSFQGVWFTNFVVGTAMVLPVLATTEDLYENREKVKEAINFIIKHQNDDGSFSESPMSFETNQYVKGDKASPTLTGMIVTSLVQYLEKSKLRYWNLMKSPLEKAVGYLLRSQNYDGTWQDDSWFATVFPKYEYGVYPFIRESYPMQALGLYLKLFKDYETREFEHWAAYRELEDVNFYKDGKGMHLGPNFYNYLNLIKKKDANSLKFTNYIGKRLGIEELEDLNSKSGLEESRGNIRTYLNKKYGFIENNGEIKGIYQSDNKKYQVASFGCIGCHSGKAAGRYFMGLGNKNIDIQKISQDSSYLTEVVQPSWLLDKVSFKTNKYDKFIELTNSSQTMIKKLKKQNWSNQTQGMVSTGLIREWFYNVLGETMPAEIDRGETKVPHLWGYGEKRHEGQFCDGFGEGKYPGWGLAVELVGGQTPENVLAMEPAIERGEQLLGKILPPAYPYLPKEKDKVVAFKSQIKRGKINFRKFCMECHGSYNKDANGIPVFKKPKFFLYGDIQTDRVRLDANTDEFVEMLENNPVGKLLSASPKAKTKGYFAPRLDGVWARFPYLHNGSVPTIRDLLTKPEERPKYFSLIDAGEEYRYSKENMGLTLPQSGSKEEKELNEDSRKGKRYIYDTTRVGHSNKGHFYEIGLEEMTEKEKEDVIKYLQTL